MPSLQGLLHSERQGSPRHCDPQSPNVPSSDAHQALASLLRTGSWFKHEDGSVWPPSGWGAHEKLAWLRSQVIGRDAHVDTPFGRHKMVYADHTASWKPLHFLEDFMLRNVLPFYGNQIETGDLIITIIKIMGYILI